MKAAMLKEIGKPFSIESVPKPKIGPDEILIETRTCGICRTDIHIQDGLAYVPELPHIPGHEPAGVVFELGSQVNHIQIGQRVIPYLFITCGHCRYCRTGREAQCLNVEDIIGVTSNGGFAEYFSVPARNALIIPDNVSFEAAGLVSCAVITALHAYRRARLMVNDTAVVIGAGGIGLILIQILKSAGIRVIAVSRSPKSLELASEYGADLTLRLGSDDTIEQARAFTGGEGAQCAFDMVGLASTMKTAAGFVTRGGQIVIIGEEVEFPAVDSISIAQRELEIIGSRNGGIQDAIDSLKMMSAGIIQPIIDRHFTLDDFNKAMKYVRSGKAHGRIIINVKQ